MDHLEVLDYRMAPIGTSMAVFPNDDLAMIVLTNLQAHDPDSLVTGVARRLSRLKPFIHPRD